MTTQQRTTIARIEAKDEAQRFQASQAAIEGAALRGELGIDAQLRAMSEQAKALRLAGDEAGYQAIKAAALSINESRN